jgi:hypothetical protein
MGLRRAATGAWVAASAAAHTGACGRHACLSPPPPRRRPLLLPATTCHHPHAASRTRRRTAGISLGRGRARCARAVAGLWACSAGKRAWLRWAGRAQPSGPTLHALLPLLPPAWSPRVRAAGRRPRHHAGRGRQRRGAALGAAAQGRRQDAVQPARGRPRRGAQQHPGVHRERGHGGTRGASGRAGGCVARALAGAVVVGAGARECGV